MAKECPIWGTIARNYAENGNGVFCDSPRTGGTYYMNWPAIDTVEDGTKEDRVKLTSWLVEQRRLGIELPKVDSTMLDDIFRHPESSMQARMDNLLRYLEQRKKMVGGVIEVEVSDEDTETSLELLAWTESCEMDEVTALLEGCKDSKWVDYSIDDSIFATVWNVKLGVSGYMRLEELEKTNVQSDQAFVAMWFDNTMNDAFKEGIKKGIELAGYRAVRIDGVEHNNKIDDEIIAEIRRSRFLVADFTQEEGNARGGVYYEAGFAHGLNIPVIFTCREDAIDYVHFDTRQHNHILWEDKKVNDLAKRLAQRISATIGDGPLKGVNQKPS